MTQDLIKTPTDAPNADDISVAEVEFKLLSPTAFVTKCQAIQANRMQCVRAGQYVRVADGYQFCAQHAKMLAAGIPTDQAEISAETVLPSTVVSLQDAEPTPLGEEHNGDDHNESHS